MKFTDGYWQTRKGVELQNPVDVREVRESNGTLTAYSAVKPIRIKGDTLNGTMLTAEISSPMEDVIRVRWIHHAGVKQQGPNFEINADESVDVKTEQTDEQATLRTGRLTATIRKTPSWGLTFHYNGRKLTGTAHKAAAYIKDADGTPYFREMLDLGVGEQIYGLGERFTPFVKNGQVVDSWNEDGGTSSEQAYKNVPFYLSSNGYGVFVNHPERVSF
ncbi:MAG: alpha-xylosidase, partial [Cohnella sp.]|nr:alpha-xylosidase [Cohnella sp.]